jgi:putative membrane protein
MVAEPSTRWIVSGGLILVLWLAVSGIAPYDRITWLLEVSPVLIALPVMAATYRRFPLTSLLYAAIFLHAIVLIVGGTHTYARVPLGFALQDLLGTERNPYDKIGHLFQGFVPLLVAREILLRGAYMRAGWMIEFISVCVAMAISAVYELIEWGAALAMGQGADEFLGTQGDQWDTQSDMFYALIGALLALVLLGRWHLRQIKARMR